LYIPAALRVTVLGFSQGVATGARWIARGTSRVDRFVMWAGQLPPDVDPAVFASMSGGVALVMGDCDEYTSWIAEGSHGNRFASVGIDLRVETFEGGHRMDRATLQRIAGD
jgi:predicted esterase